MEPCPPLLFTHEVMSISCNAMNSCTPGLHPSLISGAVWTMSFRLSRCHLTIPHLLLLFSSPLVSLHEHHSFQWVASLHQVAKVLGLHREYIAMHLMESTVEQDSDNMIYFRFEWAHSSYHVKK